MPTFFKKNDLTEEQKANWDNAIKQYSQVQHFNSLRQIELMTSKQKIEIMKRGNNPLTEFTDIDILKKINEFSIFIINSPGHEKSSLFFRILSGEKILKNIPPLSYSYPDYEIIESDNPREISMMGIEGFDTKKLVQKKSKYVPYKHVVLNQSAWKVLKIVSPTKIEITHVNWEKDGFVWELELKHISAQESQSAIICHHNSANGKITTYDVLLKECRFHAIRHFNLLKIAQDENEFKKFEEETYKKYSKSNWTNSIINQSVTQGKELLAERLAKGLPNYATEAEIEDAALAGVQRYLDRDYFIKEGIIYKKSWIMNRILPTNINDDIYITDF